jgi:acyl-coenzyme A thioesterase PaaI-like protein
MVVKFQGGMRFQGYSDRLHGGIIALLIDAAMTHCLFARNLTGVTAELKVRYQFPVVASQAITVRVWVEKQKSRLYLLKGTLQQEGELKSTAEAKFWLDSRAGECLGQAMF